eukprot:UN05537
MDDVIVDNLTPQIKEAFASSLRSDLKQRNLILTVETSIPSQCKTAKEQLQNLHSLPIAKPSYHTKLIIIYDLQNLQIYFERRSHMAIFARYL